MLTDTCLIGLLLIAVIFDLKERRIPNLLIIIGMVMAISYQVYTGGYTGLLFCLQGLAIGIALLLIPFNMGGIGAGDVKLLGMIGAFKGSTFVVSTFLWMALWGGIIAVLLLTNEGRLGETLKRLGRGLVLSGMGIANLSDSVNKEEFSIYYPYGLAIALGVLTSYGRGWW
ncbi:MAG: prepilin peptidase [Syntrophomonas sp.]|nr:prepilin peptidase [Syntrophomonas sp.]